jgi:exopolyphosphatase/pppGpp-phosphohydrolase
MDSDLSSLGDFEEASPRMRRRVQKRVRIRFIRNREDPFELLDDREFKQRFRLSKMTVANLLEEIGPAIEPKTNRNKSLTIIDNSAILCDRCISTAHWWLYSHKPI